MAETLQGGIPSSPPNHKQEIQFFLDHVLYWPHYGNWPLLQMDYFINHHDQGHPVCYWDSEDEEWMIYHTQDSVVKVFDPYSSLDDAWELLDAEGSLDEEASHWAIYTKRDLCANICRAVLKQKGYKKGEGEA